MEKQSASTATFQIVGDEALYGKDYILEPDGGVVDISESSSGGTGGKSGPAPYLIAPPPAVRVTICVGVFHSKSSVMFPVSDAFELTESITRTNDNIKITNPI